MRFLAVGLTIQTIGLCLGSLTSTIDTEAFRLAIANLPQPNTFQPKKDWFFGRNAPQPYYFANASKYLANEIIFGVTSDGNLAPTGVVYTKPTYFAAIPGILTGQFPSQVCMMNNMVPWCPESEAEALDVLWATWQSMRPPQMSDDVHRRYLFDTMATSLWTGIQHDSVNFYINNTMAQYQCPFFGGLRHLSLDTNSLADASVIGVYVWNGPYLALGAQGPELFANTDEAIAEGNDQMLAVGVGYNYTTKWGHHFPDESQMPTSVSDKLMNNLDLTDEEVEIIANFYKTVICTTTKDMSGDPSYFDMEEADKDVMNQLLQDVYKTTSMGRPVPPPQPQPQPEPEPEPEPEPKKKSGVLAVTFIVIVWTFPCICSCTIIYFFCCKAKVQVEDEEKPEPEAEAAAVVAPPPVAAPMPPPAPVQPMYAQPAPMQPMYAQPQQQQPMGMGGLNLNISNNNTNTNTNR